jgi:hypothetical protein
VKLFHYTSTSRSSRRPESPQHYYYLPTEAALSRT